MHLIASVALRWWLRSGTVSKVIQRHKVAKKPADKPKLKFTNHHAVMVTFIMLLVEGGIQAGAWILAPEYAERMVCIDDRDLLFGMVFFGGPLVYKVRAL